MANRTKFAAGKKSSKARYMRIDKRFSIISIAGMLLLCLAFTSKQSPAELTKTYYDRQLEQLLQQIRTLSNAERAGSTKQILQQHFLNCRTAYKKAELFIDLFAPYKARQLNGPDLLKIEEENPGDSIKAHGLQVMEAILYTAQPDRNRLENETTLLIKNIEQLKNDPDRTYYFKDDKIWEAMRLGMYRTISMGITGFDAPISMHSLPETKAVISSIHDIAGFYKPGIGDGLYKKGIALITNATVYIDQHNQFNTFDRLAFIRSYANPISEWLRDCSRKAGYMDHEQRSPLNADAANLFASDIIDLAFFSPNDKYKLTKERIVLGKLLFYDNLLSGNGSRSCASCHQPEKAFTDGIKTASDLTGNRQLLRNTPTLWNTALQTKQFYDSRTEKLENQLSAVVHNADEMNGSLRNSIGNLLADKKYKQLFAAAYPENDEPISEYNIANAISSYVRSLISLNSRFDRYIRKETDSFTASERNGFNLFMGKAKCGTCHYAPVFNGLVPPLYQETESEILAVPETDEKRSTLDSDPGKAGFTKVALHKYAFKTPTIRNSALTAPYMHNGVFATLEDVLKFYNDGGGAGRGIALATQTLPVDKLHLTDKEMKDIIAFIETLNDTSGTSFAQYKLK